MHLKSAITLLSWMEWRDGGGGGGDNGGAGAMKELVDREFESAPVLLRSWWIESLSHR